MRGLCEVEISCFFLSPHRLSFCLSQKGSILSPGDFHSNPIHATAIYISFFPIISVYKKATTSPL